MPLVSPFCKLSSYLFSSFVLWRWLLSFQPGRSPLPSTPAPAWLPYFPSSAGLSHHSVEPHFEFMCRTLSHDPGGQWPHLWPHFTLFLWASGLCIASSGLVTATIPLTTGPLHMHFLCLDPLPAQCFTSLLNPSDLSHRNTSGFQLLHFPEHIEFGGPALPAHFPKAASSSPFSGVTLI